MRTALFALISFTTVTFCHSFCPMNMGLMSGMHMTKTTVQHGTDMATCPQCTSHAKQQLVRAMTHSITSVPVTPSFAAVQQISCLAAHLAYRVHPSERIATGPPLAPTNVHTIVLRT